MQSSQPETPRWASAFVVFAALSMAVSRSVIAAFMLALVAAPAVARVSRDLLESEVVSSDVDSGGEEYTRKLLVFVDVQLRRG